MCAKFICDRNCFECKFDDCINDRLEREDYAVSHDIDDNIIKQRRDKKPRKLSPLAKKRKEEYRTQDRNNARAYARAYYDLNRSRLIKYRLQNRERKSAYDREYFEKNRDKILEKHKIYGLKNKEHLRDRQKEWREKNRDKIRQYQRQYYLRKKFEQQKNQAK